MVGLLRNTLHKTIGKSRLEWKKLEEVLTDIVTTLNDRPLTYIKEEVQFPFLTPKLLFLGQTPEDPTDIENKIYDRDKNLYIKAKKQHGRDGEINDTIITLEVQFKAQQERSRG